MILIQTPHFGQKHMSIKFYNTLTRKLDEFKPVEKNTVKIYSCGPTVYDYAHIGNFRSYMFCDLLKRFLKYEGYKVIHVMNITDVDDKTIKMSQEKNLSLQEYTEKYIKVFFEDSKVLGIEKMEDYPRATEHIDDMIKLIKKLDEKGYVYTSEGSVYFNISKFKNYGQLSRIDLKGMKTGVRIDMDEYTKDDVRDFVLWKAKKEGEPSWDTEYGEGRPGWHVECSAMSSKYLGETFDIHTGGMDLIFPHHENEIAQSEGANGKKFVNYWLHCSHLIVDGEKMSKSKGNFFTLRDLLDKGYAPKALRYLLLSTHYRKQMNFTEKSVGAANSAVNKIQNFYDNLKELKIKNKTDNKFQKILNEKIKKFNSCLEDDLNISGALGNLFDLITEAHKFITDDKLTDPDRVELIKRVKDINRILDVIEEERSKELPKEMMELIGKREEARKAKDFKLSDRIREELKQKNIILEDTKEGAKWKILK